jgi:hypothetical protein
MLNLRDFAPGSPPFDVTGYWIGVMAESSKQFRDAVQTDLGIPKASPVGAFPRFSAPAVMNELRQLKLPPKAEEFIIGVLAGARGAREHHDTIGRGGGADRADHRRILRAASRWPGTVSSRQVAEARAWLTFGRSLDRLLPQLLRGSNCRPEKLYLKLCARALAKTFRDFTGKPRHGLIGRLMLRAGVFADRAQVKSCRPWDSMASTNVRCRAKAGEFCRQPCRRVQALIRQSERRL